LFQQNSNKNPAKLKHFFLKTQKISSKLKNFFIKLSLAGFFLPTVTPKSAEKKSLFYPF